LPTIADDDGDEPPEPPEPDRGELLKKLRPDVPIRKRAVKLGFRAPADIEEGLDNVPPLPPPAPATPPAADASCKEYIISTTT
jgi:hypothetical protein